MRAQLRLGRSAILLVALAIGSGLAPMIYTAPPAAAAPLDSVAMIRGAHLSPNTANVDVYLTAYSGGTARFWLSDLGYGDVSAYRPIAPGPYVVSMRPHGAPATTPAALSWRFTAQAGHAYTVAGVGMNAQLHGVVLQDDLARPPAGDGRVRVIQAASRAPHATVSVHDGPMLASGLAFAATTGYTTVRRGTWRVVAASDGPGHLRATATVPVQSGSITSVVVLDGRSGGLTVRTVLDARGPATAPRGPVPAGGGGTSSPGRALSPIRTAVAAAGLLLACVGLSGWSLRGRRRAVRR